MGYVWEKGMYFPGYVECTHGLTILNITLQKEWYLKNNWRGIVEPNRNNTFQWNISLTIALLSR